MVRVRYSFGSRHTGKIANIAKQKSAFPDIVLRVVEESDIVLQLLDSRYFKEMRNRDLENLIRDSGKKLIYVLTKSDLIVASRLKNRFPRWLHPGVLVSVTKNRGRNDLRSRIEMEASKVKLPEGKNLVNVGIIGYPNVGKSSLINFLTRRGAAKISKQAGYTKGMQKIKLSDTIHLLDTPGVIPADMYSESRASLLHRHAIMGARTYSDVKDPEDIVHALMQEHSKILEKFYGIDAKGDSEILIDMLGQKKNFLGKKGAIDIDRTARLILRDWQEGNIGTGKK